MRTFKCSKYIQCDVVKGPGWCKVRSAAAGGNMMHESPGLKVLRGQATTPQGIKRRKKKEESQVSEERQRENRTWRRK